MLTRKPFVVPICLAAICLTLLSFQHPERLRVLKSSYSIEAPPPLSELDPRIAKILILGYKDVYDDFISIWLMQSLVDSRHRDVDKLIHSINSVVRHEPKLETIYMLSCFVLMRDFKRPEACKEIILAGLRAFPKSWRLPMTQGYVSYFLLKEPAQAASFFMMAASRPSSPPYVSSLVKKIIATSSLNPEDIEASLDIMSQHGNSFAFSQLLEELVKQKSAQPQ